MMTAVGVGVGSDTIVGRQIDGFSERVVGGFSLEALEQDAGSTWRQRENDHALDVIVSQPLGTGFGRPYRPEFEIEALGDPDFFRRWVHNVYLWYGTKGGILGIVAVGLVTLVPFGVALRASWSEGMAGEDPVCEVAVPVLLAFGVMSLVDPVIINSNSGAITAGIFCLLGLRTRPSFEMSSLGSVDHVGLPGRSV
jgi:O-antigen ligase